MVAFPTIPTIQDLQVASASVMNVYNGSLRWLLAWSHRTFPSTYASRDAISRYEETYGTAESFCAQYDGQGTFGYRYEAYHNGTSGDDSYVKYEYYGDDDAWHTVVELVMNATSWTHFSGTASLSGASMTAGKVYSWRMRRRVATGRGGEYNVYVRHWFGALLGAVSGWQTPPTFTATTSAAADMAIVKADLEALQAPLPVTTPMMACHFTRTENDSGQHSFTKSVYRYRPGKLYAGIRGVSWSSWTWYVQIVDVSGNEAIVNEESIAGLGAPYWRLRTIDLTTGAPATALAAAGITLAKGSVYRVNHLFRDGGTYATISGAFAMRVSDQTPEASWENLNTWAHGDTDFGPTHLNKMSADLAELYTGGDEVLDFDTPLLWVSPQSVVHSGVRQHRFLHYYNSGDAASPGIRYGSDYNETRALESGAGWKTLDMSGVDGLQRGQYFWAYGMNCALQSEDETLDAVEAS